MQKIAEAKIEAALCQRVKELGGIAVKMAEGAPRGFPDRLCFLPGGRVLAAELKRPRGGRLSTHQMLWLSLLEGLGVAVAVISRLEDIDEALMARDATGEKRRGPGQADQTLLDSGPGDQPNLRPRI